VLNPQERRAVALHEMGHTLVALAQPGSDPVHKVSIIPRGIGALGYTLQRPTEDRYLMTRAELQRKIAVLLGGRAAEMLVLRELSTGAADDLARATDIAREMVTRYGMDEGLGHVAYQPPPTATPELALMGGGAARTLSEQTMRRIDDAVAALVAEGFARATQLLERHRALLERGAAELLEHETLGEDELRELSSPLREAADQAARPTSV
jgi:cell division protease FtsH